MASTSALPFVTDLRSEGTRRAGESRDAALQRRARRTLVDRLGQAGSPISTTWCSGTVAVQASQTHYSAGFALHLPLQQGVAVALRRADWPRLVFAADDRVWTPDAGSPPVWVRSAFSVLRATGGTMDLEAAVVSDVPPGCRDGSLAALAVALVRAVRDLGVGANLDVERVETIRTALVPRLAEQLASATEQPFSESYLLAAVAGNGPAFTLVDTATREYLPVETEARAALGWAVVDPMGAAPRPPDFHRRRREQAEAALTTLSTEGFDGLGSFRDLEHHDLERAARLVDPPLASVVRHLVSENRRVQKHVAALRRGDWQMVGGLLLMSHASLREDWQGTHAAADTLVEAVESHPHHGLYGACMTERGGAVLVVGRPNEFETGLQSLVETLESVHGTTPCVLRL